ncbi:MAG: TonB-dependent receptor [Novosphingobium sp.]
MKLVSPIRASLLGGAAALAILVPATAQARAAQPQEEAQPAPASAADETVADGNEIVVTATKREQTLQDVPVAVSVTTAETIERAQIRDIRDLSTVVPSLRVNQLQSSANTNFYIRGFGNGANNAGIEPSVGLFIDGVYRSRSASMIGDMPDIQRVEVLRGPQSTLFGKNASAGVISFTTKEPQFKLGGNFEASYGNFNAVVLKGVVTGPISETIAASLAGGYNRRDGYVTDAGSGAKENERNRWFVRGQVLFEPSSDLKIRLIGDYSKIKENCCAVVNLRAAAPTSVIFALGGKVNPASTPFSDVIYNNFPSTNDITNWGLSGQIDYHAGPIKFTSITAYRHTGAITNQDSDFSSADLLSRNYQDLRINTFTQEFRASTDWDGPLNLLVGAFYFNEKIKQSNLINWGTQARPYANQLVLGGTGGALNIGGNNASDLELIFGGLEAAAAANPLLAGKYVGKFFANGTGFTEAYALKDESFSIFGQTDFEITDNLTLTAGINYTHDSKQFSTNAVSNDVFSAINFDDPRYAVFRNQLLFKGGLAQGVGAQLGLGRSATAAEIGAFAGANFATYSAIAAQAQANANTFQNVPLANPLNALRPLQYFPQFLNVPNAVESGKIRDGDFSYTARLAYKFNNHVNAYVSYATGYKAASVNLSRDSRPTPSDLIKITAAGLGVANLTSGSRYAGPEDSTVYEFGLKGNWGVASANLAVFKQSIKGFQSNLFTGTGFFLANAGKQSAFGIEFDGMVKPTSELTFTLGVTYLNPKYDDFVLSGVGNLTGTRPGGVTPLSATWGAQYDHEFGNGDHVILRGDFHYEAPFALVEGLPNLTVKNAAGQVIDATAALQAARDFKQEINQASASLTYAMHNGMELTVWGRNILNKRTILQIFDSPAQTGSISGYPSEPRTYGVSARYRF